MKRLFALAAALLLTGCFHIDVPTNAPGNVNLSTPPRSPKARGTETPDDPGQNGVVVHASVQSGGGWTGLDGKGQGFGDVGVELSVTRNTLDKSVEFQGPRSPWRANLGWMFFRSPNDAPDRIGPSYAEVQYTGWNDAWSGSVALGATWEWTKAAAGPQATLCTGPIPLIAFCARGAYLVGEGAELGVRVVIMTGLAEWVWSR